MLQWMGGSRQKVTTSRKSIQKRQKQYFEQRRRQQHQQAAQLESLESEGTIWKQHTRDHRSLDILNLQNFSTTGTEQKPAFHSGREESKANASTDKYHAITNPQILRVSSVTAADYLETNQASSPLPGHLETQSTMKFLVDSSDNCRNEFNKTGNTPSFVKTRSQQELALYDLLSDDETNGSFQEAPTHESHVAFSVDGLGKVGIGTPPCSPQPSDRFISYGCISPRNAARQLNYPRKHSCDQNGIKYQMDEIMQDAEAPLSGSFMDLLTGTRDSYRIEMKNCSRDCMNLDTQEREVSSQFFHGKTSCNTRNNHEDLWDGSSFVDTDFLGEKKCDLALKSRPYHPQVDSPEFLELGNDELPNYNFDHVQQKRKASKATGIFNFLDPFFSMHQTSDHSPDFKNPRGARHHFVDTCFEFGDVTELPDCSPYVLEDDRGSFSFLSEESSSSTAVKAKINGVSLASFRRRDNRKHHSNDFPCDHDETVCTKEKHFKNQDGFQERKNACWSEDFTEMPILLDPKLAHFLPGDKIGPHNSWLFEQEYGATETNFGCISASPTIERKHPSAGSRAFGEHFLNENFCLSEDGAFSESPPSRSCVSGKCTSFQPATERHSKADFLKREPEFSCNFVESELEISFTEPDAFCHGEVGSVSKSNEYRPETAKVEDEQIKPSTEIPTEKNTCSSKESKERTVATRLPEKRSDKSESSVNNGIEHNSDEEVPPGCEKENKVRKHSIEKARGLVFSTADDARSLCAAASH